MSSLFTLQTVFLVVMECDYRDIIMVENSFEVVGSTLIVFQVLKQVALKRIFLCFNSHELGGSYTATGLVFYMSIRK